MDKVKRGGNRKNAGRIPDHETGARVRSGYTLRADHFAALEGKKKKEYIDLGLEITIPSLCDDPAATACMLAYNAAGEAMRILGMSGSELQAIMYAFRMRLRENPHFKATV